MLNDDSVIFESNFLQEQQDQVNYDGLENLCWVLLLFLFISSYLGNLANYFVSFSGLSWNTTDETLRHSFQSFGVIEEVVCLPPLTSLKCSGSKLQ